MHRCIELFGAPGSGKTALYQAVVTRAPASPHLRTWHAFLRDAAVSGNAIHSALRDDDDVRAFVELYLGFIPRSSDNPVTRLRRIRVFGQDIERLAAIDLAPEGPLVLFDEGIAQRGIGVSLSMRGDRRAVEAYYSAMPLPLGLVVLDPPFEVIAGQETQRGGAFDERAARRTRWVQDALARALEILRARGVELLELRDSDLAANAEKVRDFARRLSERPAGPRSDGKVAARALSRKAGRRTGFDLWRWLRKRL